MLLSGAFFRVCVRVFLVFLVVGVRERKADFKLLYPCDVVTVALHTHEQSGIGTYTIPQIATPLYAKTSKALDLMFANNLNYHVMSGYQFLMQNCEFFLSFCLLYFYCSVDR